MQLSINRYIQVAAIISLFLFGLINVEGVRGSELLTQTTTADELITVQSTPSLFDQFNTTVAASPVKRMISSFDAFEGLLHQAILQRIGTPYRSGGVDNNGYDCSGFVWRVFQEAGVDFQRASARTYWETLPEATKDEKGQFGTLVFFDNSTHVGIVRDSYSFYHASSSQGVIRSNFSEYWGAHIRGFRRIRIS